MLCHIYAEEWINYNAGTIVNAIAMDKDNNIWFDKGNILKKLDFVTRDVVEYEIPSDSHVDHIYSIAIDPDNRKWFGTDYGLLMLDNDGNWEHYNPENSSMDSPWVYKVAIDSLNRKWIGTYSGVCLLDQNGDWINHGKLGVPILIVNDIAFDLRNNVWFASSAGGVVVLYPDGSSENFKSNNSDLLSSWVYEIAIDSQNNKWFSTNKGLSILKDDGSWANYTSEIYTDIAIDSQDRKWYLTRETGLRSQNPDGSSFIFEELNKHLTLDEPNLIYIDNFDRKWIGTLYGMIILNHDDSLEFYPENYNRLGAKKINDIAVDSHDGIWFATNGGGATLLKPDGSWSRFYKNIPSHLLNVSIDSNDTKWFGTDGTGVFALYNDGSNERFSTGYLGGHFHNVIKGIDIDSTGRKWVATDDGGITAINPDNTTFNYNIFNSGLTCKRLLDIAVDLNDNIWIGAKGGLCYLDFFGSWVNYNTLYNTHFINNINLTEVDSENRKWFCNEGKGLYILNPDGSWELYNTENSGLGTNYVKSITFDDKNDNIWFGTIMGISVLYSDGSWRSFNSKNSPLKSSVNSIAIDSLDRKWIGTESNGVYMLSNEMEPAEVDIYANSETFREGDLVEVGVKVEKSFYESVDLYAILILNGVYYWYPDWGLEPYATIISTANWDDCIASFVVDKSYLKADYTFYSAITKRETFELIDSDSVTITLN